MSAVRFVDDDRFSGLAQKIKLVPRVWVVEAQVLPRVVTHDMDHQPRAEVKGGATRIEALEAEVDRLKSEPRIEALGERPVIPATEPSRRRS